MRSFNNRATSFENLTNRISSEFGFTLVEISITLIVASIGIFGMTALFSDMAKIQKKSLVSAVVTQMRSDLIRAVTDGENGSGIDSAWKRSIADVSNATGSPGILCVRDSTPCLKDTPIFFNVKNVDGNELFYSRDLTRGFTLDGVLCGTFSAATPDPNCPFRWRITAQARCPGNSTIRCVNPVVEISGDLLYSPTADDIFNGQFNASQFGFVVRRGEKTNKNEPVVLSYVTGNSLGESLGGGPGCYHNWFQRNLNVIVSDPGRNLNPSSITAPGTFRLRAGTYECRIQVPAFKNGGNKIRISGTGVNIESGIVSASLSGDSVTVPLQANFAIGADTDLKVEHYCYEKPSLAPAANNAPFSVVPDNYMLGVPVSDAGSYNGTTFTIVSCVKTSG